MPKAKGRKGRGEEGKETSQEDQSGSQDNNEDSLDQNNHDKGDHDHDLEEENEKAELEAKKVKEKKHDAGAASDLEKVTDFEEEREISTSDLSGVRELLATEMATRKMKEMELKSIKINKDDVQLIVNELEISAERAERALREHGGSLMETLVTLTN